MAGDRLVVVGERNRLARWITGILRDKNTSVDEFRDAMRRAGMILAVYMAGEAEWREVRVETPLGEATELEPAHEMLAVAVLGAGLPLVEGFSSVVPRTRIGLVAARRREEHGRVEVDVYYTRLPGRVPETVFLLDPMLATGLTAARAIEILAERGARRVVMGSVIASREGVDRVLSTGIATVYTLALDPMLDDRFFIVPGLGDAGDRALGPG